MPPKIVVSDISKTYRDRRQPVIALDRVSLQVAEGESVCIVGPSGCGKSTLLRILAGLIPQTSGQVTIAGGDRGKPLHSLVFQEYAIFPRLYDADPAGSDGRSPVPAGSREAPGSVAPQTAVLRLTSVLRQAGTSRSCGGQV